MKDQEIKVSICCITYNHEKYIRDAIKGFLIQETDFPIEIIIHDDASTDNTQNIIREYEKLHPDIIKPIFQTENQWSILQSSIYSKFVLPKAKGKYIALCEGDDYWTDPLKLQKQVSYLEKNEDFQLIVGGYKIVNCSNGSEKVVIKEDRDSELKEGYTFDKYDITRGWLTKTLTVVFRTKNLLDYNSSQFNHSRDVHLFYHLLQKGKGFYMSEVLGVYRVHHEGVFSQKHKPKNLYDHYQIYKEIYDVYGDEPARLMYIRSIKSLFSAGVVTVRDNNYFSLIKEAIGTSKSIKEILLIFKSLIPVINQITKNGRISN